MKLFVKTAIINNGFYGGDIEIEEVHKILSIEEEIPGEDDDYIEKQLYYLNYTEIDRLLEISAGIPEDAKPALYKLLYANAITMMKTFLGDTLKREVLKDDDSIRKFVENYTPFEKEEIKLSNLYHKKETLPQFIREILNSLMYHDLRKIKPIFRDTLGVDLGDVSDLYRAVLVRHDIVHRNGVKKDGLEHHITKEDVQNLQKNVQELIESVKAQL